MNNNSSRTLRKGNNQRNRECLRALKDRNFQNGKWRRPTEESSEWMKTDLEQGPHHEILEYWEQKNVSISFQRG